ncbi:MAG: hypothetical protein HY288_04425 [Planctomycetia bacterium]|nr:hypothetical protein [Planctomycetia bacterium]
MAMTFSLKSLLVLLAYAAVVCAGLFTVQKIWANLVFLFTFLGILFAAICTLFGPADRRAYWGSFAMAAAAYLALTVYPGQYSGFPATQWFEWLNERIEPIRNEQLGPPAGNTRRGMGGGMGGGMMGGMGGGMAGGMGGMGGTGPGALLQYSNDQVTLMLTARDYTPRIGHCVVALILALIAAEVGQREFNRQLGPLQGR